MYPELNAKEMKTVIIPKPINFKKPMGKPYFVAFSDTITLAAAPIIVILPPKQAPSERHHHKGLA